jgi:tripartite-type tricarboxylate transporter receptor subunit TctC
LFDVAKKPGGEIMHKREWSRVGLIGWLVACVGGLAVSDSFAQTYPAKPIHLIVGFAVGGSTDLTARMLGQRISEYWGQPVVIENRLGAGTAIAIDRVAKSPPDGYTLLFLSASGAGLSAMRTDLPYDLERDFIPVSRVSTTTFVLMVHPSVPARNAEELIALARKQPGKLTYASEGFGASAHLAGELFKSMAKVDILHVAYKGGAESSIAAASGQVDMGFPTITATLPLLAVGKIKLLAVTSATRSSLKPEIPTLAESGLPGYDRSSWNGVLAPAGVQREIVTQLHAVTVKSVASPQMKQGLKELGLDPITSTPEQFSAFIRNEIAQNVTLIQKNRK